MKTIAEIYQELVNELFTTRINIKDRNAIVFFQGFPLEFYQSLEQLDYNRFSKPDNSSDFYVDYRMLQPKDILFSFIGASGISWGYYEELLGLTEILHDFTVFNGEIFIIKNNLFLGYYPIPVPLDLAQASKIFTDETQKYKDNPILKYYSDFKTIGNQGFYSYVNKHFSVDIKIEVKEIDFFIAGASGGTPSSSMVKEIQMNDLQILKKDMIRGRLSPGTYILKSMDNHLSDEFDLLNGLGNDQGVYFELNNTSRELNYQKEQRHIGILKKYWGEDSAFRLGMFYKNPPIDIDTIEISQGILVSDIIEQCDAARSGANYSDIIITAPTGAGKSLFFQLAGIHLHEKYHAVTIVVCPLIALMHDQVKEIEERGIEFATFINSELTFEQRYDRIEGIKNGEYSIVYLSPELLLSGDISNIIGERKIGLMVIDEAHLVTTWGRDFRVDYWFLGDYLEKVRRGSYFSKKKDLERFPVLCLTATAIFGGRDDVIEDLQRSMHLDCSAEHLYIGYVCRDNISFKITNPKKKRSNYRKEENILYTIDRIEEFINSQEKSIVYFPYVSQIEEVLTYLKDQNPCLNSKIEQYSGSKMNSLEKNESYSRFRNSLSTVMLATKAFGMGVNISDIRNVYHYAPTGTLADYIQEIGRAARKLDRGYAITDYLHNDMMYAKTLWGLSGLRHYQIKAIMKKLYDLYYLKKSRNLLFSPDVFSFLFDLQNIDNKVKSGLMLLSTDLFDTYHFKVITVRPKNIFSIHYINVPVDIEQEFLGQFGKYSAIMKDDKPRITHAFGNQQKIVTYNNGHVYEINLADIWENEFSDITFALFKRRFFNGDLFTFGDGKVSPRLKLVIHYSKGYDYAKENLLPLIVALQKTLNGIHRSHGGKQFAFEEFYKHFTENYAHKKIRKEYITILLDLFCFNRVDIYELPTEQWKFIEKRKESPEKEFNQSLYRMILNKHNFIGRNLTRYLDQAAPNTEDPEKFVSYLPIPKDKERYSEYQLLASILEMFDFATYELNGGSNPQIFVRINDPLKLKRIADAPKEYRNKILSKIEERHRRSAVIVDKFMTTDLTDKQRWGIIQNYFLGFDGVVDQMLDINE